MFEFLQELVRSPFQRLPVVYDNRALNSPVKPQITEVGWEQPTKEGQLECPKRICNDLLPGFEMIQEAHDTKRILI